MKRWRCCWPKPPRRICGVECDSMDWGNLTIAAAALSLGSLFVRWRFPAVPQYLASFGLGASLAALAMSFVEIPTILAVSIAVNVALSVGWLDYVFCTRPGADVAEGAGANLRLTFYGDARHPTCQRSTNTATWFAYYSPEIQLIGEDAEGLRQPIVKTPKTWAIFIAYDLPTEVTQILASLNTQGLPHYQILMSTKRACVIAFAGDIPAGDLEIEVRR